MAEGEELGSNLLHVAQSSPGDPGGSGSLKLGRRSEIPGQTGRWLYVTVPQPAARPAGQPNPVTPMEYGRGGLDRISEPGTGLGTWIRPDNSRQLKDLSPEVLHLRGQKQILPIRHRQDGI